MRQPPLVSNNNEIAKSYITVFKPIFLKPEE